MTFIEMSRKGPPLFVRPEHVAAVRPPRAGEAGESVIVLVSGAELVCGYDAGHARARLSRDWPVDAPPFDTENAPNSEQRAVIHGLYDRLNATA